MSKFIDFMYRITGANSPNLKNSYAILVVLAWGLFATTMLEITGVDLGIL